MALFGYNLLLFLLSPLIACFLLYRRSIGKEDRGPAWAERWGRMPESLSADPRRPRFWVHAVSVGEVMAAVPILRALRIRWPEALIVVSTTTPSGREVAQKQVPPADAVVYFPLDFLPVVDGALRGVRPDAVLLMEWEIWPNFITRAKRRGAKIAVLNGRISDNGLKRGQSKGSIFLDPAFSVIDLFAMQSDEDARRAVGVGANPARVATFGNTKFDESVSPLTQDERTALRADLGIPQEALVWVCGSTRDAPSGATIPDEEQQIALAFQTARQRVPNLRLIVAPRHLDRAERAAELLREAGLRVARRSRRESLGNADALLLDTFGELGRVYAVAQVAFVGGSLVPTGGQSVFQPLAQGVPALFGPHMNNQRDIAALSQAEGVGKMVRDTDALAQAVVEWTTLSPGEREALGQKARALIERNQGVAARCVEAVAKLLGTSAP